MLCTTYIIFKLNSVDSIFEFSLNKNREFIFFFSSKVKGAFSECLVVHKLAVLLARGRNLNKVNTVIS